MKLKETREHTSRARQILERIWHEFYNFSLIDLLKPRMFVILNANEMILILFTVKWMDGWVFSENI